MLQRFAKLANQFSKAALHNLPAMTRFFSKENPFDPETAMVQAKGFESFGSINTPIVYSSTFEMDPSTMTKVFKGEMGPEQGFFLYGRHLNPTIDHANRKLAAMEKKQAALLTSSGMSAIACTFMQHCKQGSHIVAGDTIYGGTYALLNEYLPKFGITTTFVNAACSDEIERALKSNTRLVFIETAANPTLQIPNIPEAAELTGRLGLPLVIDNTFTPLSITPARFGDNIITIHSLTKFISGGNDIIAGVICGDKEFIDSLIDLHKGSVMLVGPTIDPHTASRLEHRLQTLPVRIAEHSKRALAVAKTLENMGIKVIYPGLISHQQHQLFTSMMNPKFGYGGMIAMDCGTTERAEQFILHLKNSGAARSAVSLGGYQTLVSCSGSSTSSEIPPEEQKIPPGLVRMSVGTAGTSEWIVEKIKQAAEKTILNRSGFFQPETPDQTIKKEDFEDTNQNKPRPH